MVEFEFNEHKEVNLKVGFKQKAPHSCSRERFGTFLTVSPLRAAHPINETVEEISNYKDRSEEVEGHFEVRHRLVEGKASKLIVRVDVRDLIVKIERLVVKYKFTEVLEFLEHNSICME